MKYALKLFAVLLFGASYAQGIVLPAEFEDLTILDELRDPSTIAFAPDGRLFISERITGQLRIAKQDTVTGSWSVLSDPFYTFDVPPTAHRSSGLRGIAFDPSFVENGYVYAFYMKDNPRHNRVVRIQADPAFPDTAMSGELLLLEVPFNNSSSSGSHNGGDLVFGDDGKLYFTTGDGWNGGDDVQSLDTYTGKLFRINSDGSIPTDNPFYNEASGNFRSIYALGLRNPYTIAKSETGNIYINDAVGSSKATVYQVQSDGSSAGANFGHDGFDGIGTLTDEWANTAVDGAKLITGGAWYPGTGYWPEEYRGSYYAAMWGTNSGSAGDIVRVQSESNISVSTFASEILIPPRHKPVMTEIGPDMNLYYLLTDYQTGDGAVHTIRYTGQAVAGAPAYSPPPGQYDDPLKVAISSSGANATIYFTTDGSDPDSTANLYVDSIALSATGILKSIAYADSALPSAISTGEYIIGPIPNLAPMADAGPDLIVEVGRPVTLNGAGSIDPDGSPLEIAETWVQTDGPSVNILDDDETVANFLPSLTGTYTFALVVEDVDGARDSSTTRITAVRQIPDVLDDLIARWSCETGSGTLLEDYSPNANRGNILGPSWSSDQADQSDHSITFDGSSNTRVDIGNLDITGSEMTICFWAKLRSYQTQDARFISKADGQNDSDHLWMVSTLNDSRLRFRLNTDNGGTTTLITNTGAIPLDEWIHIAAVYDGSEMKLYKNAAQVAMESKTGNIATAPSMSAAIGNQPQGASGGTRPLDGWMDEIRIYSRALTASEIDTVMTAAVEKCELLVTNTKDGGNGSLRRCIDCAKTGDTVTFEELGDTIHVTTASININNSLSISGNSTQLPRIQSALEVPVLEIREGIGVSMDKLDILSDGGEIIVNRGNLILGSIRLIRSVMGNVPAIRNEGDAHVEGELRVEVE